MTPRNPGILSKAGVKVAIQTDEMSAARYLVINAALALQQGMEEEEALNAITINPAEIIGVADRVGRLEKGRTRIWWSLAAIPWTTGRPQNWFL